MAFSQWPQDDVVEPLSSTKPTVRMWKCHITECGKQWDIFVSRCPSNCCTASAVSAWHLIPGSLWKVSYNLKHWMAAGSSRGIGFRPCWFTCQITSGASNVRHGHKSGSRCMWCCMASQYMSMGVLLWMHVEQFRFFLLPIMQPNEKKSPLKALPNVQSSIPCILLDIRFPVGL